MIKPSPIFAIVRKNLSNAFYSKKFVMHSYNKSLSCAYLYNKSISTAVKSLKFPVRSYTKIISITF